MANSHVGLNDGNMCHNKGLALIKVKYYVLSGSRAVELTASIMTFRAADQRDLLVLHDECLILLFIFIIYIIYLYYYYYIIIIHCQTWSIMLPHTGFKRTG